MSWVAVAVGSALIGSTVYGADQSRKNMHKQQAALEASQADDARQAAEAETGAQVAANARIADTKRRRRSSALSLGDPSGSSSTLGGGSVLSAGGPAPTARNATLAGAAPAGTALGAGGSSYNAGRVRAPTRPTRVGSI